MQRGAAVRIIATVGMLGGIVVSAPAHAERTIGSVLFVSKSENKNQVHYGIHLDDQCAFAGSAPVYPYWRMLERSPAAIEPLLDREQRAYGIERQDVHADTVRLTLRALHRVISVRVTQAADGTCRATAETTISGHDARLFNVHVALGFLRVDHLVLQGWDERDGRVVSERIEP